MSFGSKLDQMPITCAPNEETVVTLELVVPDFVTFELEATVFVEEPAGIRSIALSVRNAPKEPGP